MKIIKSKESYLEAFKDELEILEALSKEESNPIWQETVTLHNESFPLFQLESSETFVIKKLEHFFHYGMFGKHPCITFEIVGPSLLDLIEYCCDEKGSEVPLPVVK